jgi:hypothetical protein
MTEFELTLYVATFAASFIAGFMNMAFGDPLGLKRLYRFCGLIK